MVRRVRLLLGPDDLQSMKGTPTRNATTDNKSTCTVTLYVSPGPEILHCQVLFGGKADRVVPNGDVPPWMSVREDIQQLVQRFQLGDACV